MDDPGMSLNDFFFGTAFPLVFGIIFIIFRRQVARQAADFQYKYFKRRVNEKGVQIVYVIVGTLFLVFGLLHAFGGVQIAK